MRVPAEQVQAHDLDFIDRPQKVGDILDHYYPQCVSELTRCDSDKARIREFNRDE